MTAGAQPKYDEILSIIIMIIIVKTWSAWVKMRSNSESPQIIYLEKFTCVFHKNKIQ